MSLESEEREVLVRALASLAVFDKKAHFIMLNHLEGIPSGVIMTNGGLPSRTFHRKFQIGRDFILRFIEGETYQFRVNMKFPRI